MPSSHSIWRMKWTEMKWKKIESISSKCHTNEWNTSNPNKQFQGNDIRTQLKLAFGFFFSSSRDGTIAASIRFSFYLFVCLSRAWISDWMWLLMMMMVSFFLMLGRTVEQWMRVLSNHICFYFQFKFISIECVNKTLAAFFSNEEKKNQRNRIAAALRSHQSCSKNWKKKEHTMVAKKLETHSRTGTKPYIEGAANKTTHSRTCTHTPSQCNAKHGQCKQKCVRNNATVARHTIHTLAQHSRCHSPYQFCTSPFRCCYLMVNWSYLKLNTTSHK